MKCHPKLTDENPQTHLNFLEKKKQAWSWKSPIPNEEISTDKRKHIAITNIYMVVQEKEMTKQAY